MKKCEIRKKEIKLCLATGDVTRAVVFDWMFLLNRQSYKAVLETFLINT